MGALEIRNKLLTPAEAVRRFIKDGSQIALGGFTINRNPMGLVYEIIRQGIRNLHLVCHSNGQALDVLIGAGCVSKVEVAYAGNGRFAPTCLRFRRAVEGGEIEVEDYSNYQMSLRFLAGSVGVPFIPTKTGLGTDLITREGFSADLRKDRKMASQKYVLMQNPFYGKTDTVLLLPALKPDVTLLHAQYVGEDGTVRIKGLTFADVEQAKASDAVIVTCEEVVPKEFIRTDPDQNSLPTFLVDAIVPLPFGAHPTACAYFYDYDVSHLNLYRKMAAGDHLFRTYLKEWILGVSNQEEYLDRVGGKTLSKIRANCVIPYAPGLDRR